MLCSNVEMHEAGEAFLHSLFGSELYEEWKRVKMLLKFDNERQFVGWMLGLTKDHIMNRLNERTAALESKPPMAATDVADLWKYYIFTSRETDYSFTNDEEPENLVKVKDFSNKREDRRNNSLPAHPECHEPLDMDDIVFEYPDSVGLSSNHSEGGSPTTIDDEGHEDILSPKHVCTSLPYICDVCGTGFEQNVFLKIHSRIHSNLTKADNDPTLESVTGYVREPSEAAPSQLEVDATAVNQLEAAGSNTSRYSHHCPHCDRSFTREMQLLSHLKCHGIDKPFSCRFCSLTFSQVGALNAHVRVHTGERPFACDFCDKRFSVKTNLLRHRRLHTGERPHVCNVCERGFSRIDTYRSHVQSCERNNMRSYNGDNNDTSNINIDINDNGNRSDLRHTQFFSSFNISPFHERPLDF